MAFHDLISIAPVVWLKNANRPKNVFENANKSRKIVVSEPQVFSIENRLPLQNLAVKKGTKRKNRHHRAYHYFSRENGRYARFRFEKTAVCTILARENDGTHDFGSRKIAP